MSKIDKIANSTVAVIKEAKSKEMSTSNAHDPYEGKTPCKVEKTDGLIVEYYDTEPTPEQILAWKQFWRMVFQRVMSRKEGQSSGNSPADNVSDP